MALLFASGLPCRRFLLLAVLAPYAVSEVSAVVTWRYLFDPDIGPLTTTLQALGLPILDWTSSPTDGLLMVALLSVWLNMPFAFIILYAARLAIPGDLYEAALVDGTTPLQSFRHVTLPLLAPAILMAMLFRYIIAFRLFSEVWLLTAGEPGAQHRSCRRVSLSRGIPLQCVWSSGSYRLAYGRGCAATGRRVHLGPAP
jgi:multiple sugar transport system permease protein